ncbi:MAG: pirin-like C-terminal cupin domain-containing protein, partial [Eubacteriales bacterium]|nr:pirin-like C-terminal cupin domain-containing protein [Eubacteriales bacterium]
KMTAPKYRDIKMEDVPVINIDGGIARVVASGDEELPGASSGDFVPLTMLDITLEPGAGFTRKTGENDTVFAYIFEGSGIFGRSRQPFSARHALLTGEGDTFSIAAGENGMRLVLCESKALREPIAWGGPIVMNTREELQRAFDELDEGTFIK